MKKNSLLFLAGCIIIITVLFVVTALNQRKAQEAIFVVSPEKRLVPLESVQPEDEVRVDEREEEPHILSGEPLLN